MDVKQKSTEKYPSIISQKTPTRSGLFVAEGEKLVHELLNSGWKADQIYSTEPLQQTPYTLVHFSEMKKISHLSSASPILGVFHLPHYDSSAVDHRNFHLYWTILPILVIWEPS